MTDWFPKETNLRVALAPDTTVIVFEHRRGESSGVYYYEGLGTDALVWCAERGISPPLVNADPNTGGWILTFTDPDAAFEFKLTWA